MTDLSNQDYNSPKTLSYFVIGGLSIIGLMELLSFLSGVGQIVSPNSMIGGNQPLWVIFQGLIALIQFPCFILTVILFLVWINRANKNLTPLRVSNIEFSSGWAVGWWFIPFANLVKPFQVVREIWNESDPDFDPSLSFLSSSAGAPPLLSFWWGFWIISNIASNISNRMFNDLADQMERATAQDLELTGYFFIISGVLTAVAAFLAIKVVHGITNRQEERFAKVGAYKQSFQEPPLPPTFN